MAGLLDMFKPQLDAPEHKIVPIDAGTNDLINQDVSLAGQSPEQIAAQRLQGVDQAAGQAQQSDQHAAQQQASLGYSSPGMNQAIRNQYNSQAGDQINRLKNAYGQSAQFEKAAMLQQGFAEAQARQNVTMQSYSRLMDVYNQTEAARAQMLSSILGAAGTGAGMYAGMHQKRSRPPSAGGSAASSGGLGGQYDVGMNENTSSNFVGGYSSAGESGNMGGVS